MAHPAFAAAQRMLSAYVEDEPWKRDHVEAMECFAFQEHLACGNAVFQYVWCVARSWRQRVEKGLTKYTTEDEQQILEMIRRWSQRGDEAMKVLANFEERDYDIEGASMFCLNYSNATDFLRRIERRAEAAERVGLAESTFSPEAADLFDRMTRDPKNQDLVSTPRLSPQQIPQVASEAIHRPGT